MKPAVSSNNSRIKTAWGFCAGIITGVTYGLNPLFAKPLLSSGVSVDTMLSFRYLLAVAFLGIWLLARRESFKIHFPQFIRLTILGVFYGLSSLLLFTAYNYIPAGLATTIVFLYPVLVALIMVFLKVYPTWQVWVSIFLTFAGVLVLSHSSDNVSLNYLGLLLAGGSALAYALYLVIVNRSRRLRSVSNHVLTFYALLIGSLIFLSHSVLSGEDFMKGMQGYKCWLNVIGLAVFPTVISMLTLAIATRIIGATKTSVLGVFEPITAIAVGTIFFGESLTLNIIVGVAITLVAVTFMVVTSKSSN